MLKARQHSIVTAYAPTLYSNPDVKDQFYNALDYTIRMLAPSEHIYLLADCNARVGAEHSTWPTCIGHHGVGKRNGMWRDFLSYAVTETSM